MLNNTKRIKELYEEIQRKIFYIVPGKWDELYLYASIIDRLGKVQTGEMYFYFMPKGILKRKFINVYEVPAKYDIEEEEYLKLVELLYDCIKKFWRYKYLNIEPHSKKERQAIEQYLNNQRPSEKKDEEYDTGIYLKRKTNIITYDTTDFKSTQRVEYLATKQETKKVKNQILCNK